MKALDDLYVLALVGLCMLWRGHRPLSPYHESTICLRCLSRLVRGPDGRWFRV